jgi:hypothetical protein
MMMREKRRHGVYAFARQDGVGHLERDRQAGADELSAKARQGTLTPEERAELDEPIRVRNELAVLQNRRPGYRSSG